MLALSVDRLIQRPEAVSYILPGCKRPQEWLQQATFIIGDSQRKLLEYIWNVSLKEILYTIVIHLMLFSTAVWAEPTILQIQRCDYRDQHACEQVSYMKHERKVVGKLFAPANHSLQNYFG